MPTTERARYVPPRLDLPDAEIRRRYEDEGWTLVRLAAAYSVSPATIADRVRRAGGQMRTKGVRPTSERAA